VSKTICHLLIAGLLCGIATAHGGESPAKFLGANSCASSGCHGGGGGKQNQFLTWSLKDFHSQRPPATLATARSKQIGEALGIPDPTADVRCTICHAPLSTVPADRRGPQFKVSEGVSCESCHGPVENWLRPHTRTDYTRADRTAAGLRDLQNLYVRANTCVACHQVAAQPLLQAGHPELIFELDGQSVAEPEHWSAEKNGNGAQAWFVGQAVALRELSWQVIHEQAQLPEIPVAVTDTNLVQRCNALFYILRTATGETGVVQRMSDDFDSVRVWADKLAREKSGAVWSDQMTQEYLARLAGLAGSFSDTKIPQPVLARRAERLVLALDRLVAAQPGLKNNEAVQSSLNQLFQLAQSLPDFDPKPFADALQKFSAAVAAQP
jgi:hypothetical protein